MGSDSDRSGLIAELQREARSSGSFVDRAIVREIKNVAARCAETDPLWSEVLHLTRGWKAGLPELQVLDGLQRINRAASCWKAPNPITM